MKEGSSLKPKMSKEALKLYFKDRLPSGEIRDLLLGVKVRPFGVKSFSCLDYARLILEEFGGPDQARIYWLENDERGTGHAFVVPNELLPRQSAFNSFLRKSYKESILGPHTAGFLRRNAEDVTEEVLVYKWEAL